VTGEPRQPLRCEDVRELAAEAALDVLPGDERAAVLEHLETCPGCQSLVDELAGSADRLLLALPEADPPEGFAVRTVAAMQAQGQPLAAHRRRRLGLLVAAAAALLAVALGGLLVRAAGDGTGGGADLAVPLVVPGGGPDIGELTITAGDAPWISWRIDDGEGTHRYTCVLVLTDGSTEPIGPLDIADGRGSWGRVLPYDRDQLQAARVVDDGGRTIAWADLR
jgi:hypothetical protein